MTDLSILNLAPLRDGETFADAVDDLVALAQLAERLGYTRYWIAEHHNMPYLASSATSLLIGQGLGRAPGTDPATAKAIRRHQDDFVSSFPSDIKELQFYFGDDKSDKVRAYPAKGLNVPLYILGSSPESAYLAAELGLPYAFASHFAPRFLTQAVEIYRKEFKPSDVLDKPKVIVGLNAIVADTDSEAKLLATTSLQFFLNVVTGERSGMKPPVPDIESRIPPHILSMAKSMTACSVIGSPKTVKAQLEQLQKQVNADEFMVVSYIYDKDKQARSYELILEAVDG